MKNLNPILIFMLIFMCACSKDKDNPNVPSCYKEMKERFEKVLKCTKQNSMEVNLYSALYQGKTIFFPMTMCPTCSTVAPAEGYTCAGEKVTIEKFSDVGTITLIYNSCTKKYKEAPLKI
ncbi:hypothetical protein GQF61_13940 [Sphingobacterium sp. DK4209]|uniref:Lipoprotein n=1 Tax=Sphingobacterium zhuxiongii TaxID=2662364 RepID=A0A5Q0QB01_9SPHI|nr:MULTISPECIES: hypothetical protein [unclassified Sphingobacterium]MVZ66957.1 hypothetical protein [Sphingobacterium sp. DK4209]QGA26626.1 hypothetical protein GFH32_09940 [Sphingobacterium sp. dk4302]